MSAAGGFAGTGGVLVLGRRGEGSAHQAVRFFRPASMRASSPNALTAISSTRSTAVGAVEQGQQKQCSAIDSVGCGDSLFSWCSGSAGGRSPGLQTAACSGGISFPIS